MTRKMYEVILHKNAAKYYRNPDKKPQGRINKNLIQSATSWEPPG